MLVLQPHAASITAAYAGIKRLHYAHGLKQMRFLVNGVADAVAAQQITSNLAQHRQPLPRGARCSPRAGCAPTRIVADARRLKQDHGRGLPASPAAVDFRRIAGEVGRWPWRPRRARRPSRMQRRACGAALERRRRLSSNSDMKRTGRVHRTGNH